MGKDDLLILVPLREGLDITIPFLTIRSLYDVILARTVMSLQNPNQRLKLESMACLRSN